MSLGPVVVQVRLGSPVVGRPVHLDGLLALAWVRRHAPEALDLPSRVTPLSELVHPRLPLARLRVDDEQVWLAGASEMAAPRPARAWAVKKRDPEDWDRLDRPVLVTGGPAKDRRVLLPAVSASAATWYCWGDLREIARALRLLWGSERDPYGQLGSDRRGGAGQLLSWSAERGDHAPSRCLVTPESTAARNLPAGWIAEGRADWGAIAPPYWHPEAQVPVARAGEPVQLWPHVWSAADELAGAGR